MKHFPSRIFGLMLVLSSLPAAAIEYYELEVYGYNLASKHEIELENGSSFSSDSQSDVAGRIFRSSFEMNYGLTEHLELAAYLDYTSAQDQFEYTAFRTHLRTNFFEKGEMPVDMGAYAELALPRNFRQTDVSLEFKGILEKDFSRWTLTWNPMVELSHTSGDTDDVILGGDTDDGFNTTVVTREKSWQANWSSSTSLSYNLNSKLRPHLDWYTSLTDGSALLVPSLDFKIGTMLKASAGFGFGLNERTEQRLVSLRMEYEIY